MKSTRVRVGAAVAAVAIVAIGAYLLWPKESGGRGPSRVAVKHALDPDAASINTSPKDISLEELVAMKMPAEAEGDLSSYQNKRVPPFEKQIWRVQATVKSVELKKDGDFYMVVEGKNGTQGIVEVPDPELCKGSPLYAQIKATREALDKKYHPTKDRQEVNEQATLSGVGFLGWKGRPGSGASGNSARLMPGTGISFGG